MKINRRFFVESLMVRLGIALGAIALLAVAATISATVFSELSTGKATAINFAGSLRMQSYWITLQVLRSDGSEHPPAELEPAMAAFESRLHSPLLLAGIPADSADPTRQAYERVAAGWSSTFKPAITRVLAEDPPARNAFIEHTAAYVRDVDRLVYLIEHDLERRIQTLRLIQGTALFAIVVVLFITLYLMRTRALEATVEEKTEQLARSNVSLELLYNTTRTLAENPLTEATLDTVMSDIERVIGLEAGAICVREEGDRRGFPLARRTRGAASTQSECALSWCGQERCDECFEGDHIRALTVGNGADRMLAVPLTEGGKPCGVMLLRMPPGMELEAWKLKLLESIGHHIGAALAAAKRGDEQRRISLMEERSIIARELHDSLAQSLSYLKIQVTRLQSCLDGSAKGMQAADVVEELKMGLNNAYRQLRELLTTFRLRMDGRGLSDALRDTIGEFSRRTGIDFRLNDRLFGHELDASEQIHVLQVVREALNNVEHHARSRRADVRLAIVQGRVRVTVDDDGVGVLDAEAPMHHYGLAIMRDRAAALGGTLRISGRSEGGTRVELDFSPRGSVRADTRSLRAT